MTTMTREWNDLTELEKMSCEYSDFHKSAYGYRPRFDRSSWTEEDYRVAFIGLGNICRDNEREREESEKAASFAFETTVTKLVKANNIARATAVRWLMEADGVDGDDEYFCYKNGLPYGYFRKGGEG